MTQQEMRTLTDRQLHDRCRTCGVNIRKLQKELAGYLHEVAKRGLYKRYGFYSLYEYAAKLAGMSQAVVDEIMAVHKKLEDKPVLKDLISEQGWTKLKIVATYATPENQEFWAGKVRQMSKSTLETYVRELRKKGRMDVQAMHGGEVSRADVQVGHVGEQPDLFTSTEDVSGFSPGICNQMEQSQKSAFTIRLDSDTETKLRIFKHRYEKQSGEPRDWNDVMRKFLKIAEEHELCCKKRKNDGPANERAISKKKIRKSLPVVSKRHIPASIKKYLVQKYEGKCAYPDCKNPAEIFHHTRRFALQPNHDPDFIAPLCKAHERLAHHGVIENEEYAPEKWSVSLVQAADGAKKLIDAKVNNYRKPDG